MKVYKLFPLLFVCLTASAQGIIDDRNYLQRENLKGNVKSIKNYEYEKVEFMTEDEYKSYIEKGVKPPSYRKKWTSTVEFNRAGNIVKSRCPSGRIGDYYDITYRSDNQQLSKTTYNDDGSVRFVYRIEYDEKGHALHGISKSDKEVYFEEFFTWNEKGKLSSFLKKNRDGSKMNITFEYKNGILNKWSMTNNDKPYLISIVDGDFFKAKETFDWTNGSCTHKRLTTSTDGLTETIEVEKASGEWYLNIERIKDTHGNTIKETEYDKDGNIKRWDTYTYEYDNHGNWIRKVRKSSISYLGGTTLREIEYY